MIDAVVLDLTGVLLEFQLDFDRRFDHCFFSNEIGHRKPDAAIYTHMLDRLGLSEHPERVVFLDDSPACVDGARLAGMLAYETAGVAEVRARLETIGLLPGERT